MIALASRHGYSNVSIAQISSHAGVSSATFYEQFADKEDCLLAAYRKAAARLLERVPALDAARDWQERAASSGGCSVLSRATRTPGA